jgi:hypothetical protein
VMDGAWRLDKAPGASPAYLCARVSWLSLPQSALSQVNAHVRGLSAYYPTWRSSAPIADLVQREAVEDPYFRGVLEPGRRPTGYQSGKMTVSAALRAAGDP